ncbi:MAG: RluA family pseudouridine synthase [Candidatus Omnitrophica bacterium]|nr:RluA family pseudouridine synthase [Candidatus Omnitrophota bacterium]MBU4487987.1 RluA family pseudouridine synthase [Candidatus Omnitrophota bacterium]MCG2704770.1 RluA family pseudouridine synthase [Candidatus Omnitrophota bacterium]
MENYTFAVDLGGAGARLDKYLVERFPKFMSRTHIQRLITDKKVLVNGSPRNNHYKLEKGDFIEVEVPKARKLDIKAENIPLKIIYEDARLMVVDKPAGMVTHPAPGNYTGTLVNALLNHTKNLSFSSEMKPGIVHRLDKDTSGLMIVAKDESSHAFLARQFNKRTTDKRYTAVVEGVVELDNGIISEPIGRHPRDRKKMSVRLSESRQAVTRYKVLERFMNSSLLEVRPETGRTHQIRVHMAYIGHPIIGDATYGSKKSGDLMGRQALHASSISVFHPDTKEVMKFESKLPEDMKKLIVKLRMK